MSRNGNLHNWILQPTLVFDLNLLQSFKTLTIVAFIIDSFSFDVI